MTRQANEPSVGTLGARLEYALLSTLESGGADSSDQADDGGALVASSEWVLWADVLAGRSAGDRGVAMRYGRPA